MRNRDEKRYMNWRIMQERELVHNCCGKFCVAEVEALG
jgi:hypothetical protein